MWSGALAVKYSQNRQATRLKNDKSSERKTLKMKAKEYTGTHGTTVFIGVMFLHSWVNTVYLENAIYKLYLCII